MTALVEDVPSPIDFHDRAQARAWMEATIKSRPWRPDFFAAFTKAINDLEGASKRVIELGSGPGHLAKEIVQHCDIEKYVALDFSRAMHELTREHLGDQCDKVQFIECDFRADDWVRNVDPCDIAVSMQAIHEVRHTAHQPPLFKDTFNVLKPSGTFLYSDHYYEAGTEKHPNLMLGKAEQPELLARTGFKSIQLLLDKGGMALYQARKP